MSTEKDETQNPGGEDQKTGSQIDPDVRAKIDEASKTVGVKLVPESDLLAVKGSLEGKLTKAEQAVVQANSVAEAKTAALSEAQQKAYQLEAQYKELEAKQNGGAKTAEELATVKKELENAQKSVEGLTTKVLESRKQVLVATFNINPEVVANKSLEQLDAFEDALKAVATAKGIGNFAVGAATGGGGDLTARGLIKKGFDQLHPTG